ncbi:UNVERIFIED_CONTAM: hypothetical protein Slati_2767100 [Sesamum latifolium]|uniref:Uncharacterized protein n=1 Tax=Sesamum latifolium TaxID=2727402 RepID=A0AAW2VYY1_9LAMI
MEQLEGNRGRGKLISLQELFLRMMEEYQNQPNNDQDPPLSSQCLVAPTEQQVWLSAMGCQKRGRVFGRSSNHTIAGQAQPSMSTASSPSP